ncbi:hypothetical protein CA85_48580 [Allorhodopirellula solitaria]|uniref:Uncharacterized protein n=1 Tax=Allorhodopirellula solitaria TaxID=2527987 RepID=A0A5C5WXH7_9BACT|nr:hypothetical protein CA85_48580 [Allorhodopirellula solitaria]
MRDKPPWERGERFAFLITKRGRPVRQADSGSGFWGGQQIFIPATDIV